MNPDVEKTLARVQLMQLSSREEVLEEMGQVIPLAEKCLALEDLSQDDREKLVEILRLARKTVKRMSEVCPPHLPESLPAVKDPAP
jgi:hypothetical protein